MRILNLPAGPASSAANVLPAEPIDPITWSLSQGADDYVDTGVTPVPSNHPVSHSGLWWNIKRHEMKRKTKIRLDPKKMHPVGKGFWFPSSLLLFIIIFRFMHHPALCAVHQPNERHIPMSALEKHSWGWPALQGLPMRFKPRDATSLSGNVFKQQRRSTGKALGWTTASVRRQKYTPSGTK